MKIKKMHIPRFFSPFAFLFTVSYSKKICMLKQDMYDKCHNMHTQASTHTHTESVAALIIYRRPTLLTLAGKKTTEQRKQDEGGGGGITEEEETNERLKKRRAGESEAASRWCFLICWVSSWWRKTKLRTLVVQSVLPLYGSWIHNTFQSIHLLRNILINRFLDTSVSSLTASSIEYVIDSFKRQLLHHGRGKYVNKQSGHNYY